MYIEAEEFRSELRWSRGEIIRELEQQQYFDVLVIGGGIHGAAVARLAAFNGLKTALLESADYASATSSRSSKLAHGGLRYLAMADFRQVFEGVKAREDLYQVAKHLVKPTPFLLPVKRREHFRRLQFAIGLPLYELFGAGNQRRHRWLPVDDPEVQGAFHGVSDRLAGCYCYFDGVMRDTRLVIESIFAARQEGALCLNYARVDSLNQRVGNQVEVGWSDLRNNKKYHLRAGVVINCAGPWAPNVGRLTPLSGKVVYSQGTHLLFDRHWPHSALILPLKGLNRYYFVLPHPYGTLVGTTEREVKGDLPLDPQPTPDEIDEILQRLRDDLPEHQLDRKSLSYAFAGIRTLPLRAGAGDTSALSRRHCWEMHNGVLTLYGGKYTSAYWTAYEGLKIVQRESLKGFQLQHISSRCLPGAYGVEEGLADALSQCHMEEERAAVCHAHGIFGGRVRHLIESEQDKEVIGGQLLRGAVRFCLEYEQVETLEDLMRRRLELEFRPDHGLPWLSQIGKIFSELRPQLDISSEERHYGERMRTLHKLLQIATV